MKAKILMWDKDGTVTGAKDPNDHNPSSKVILPGVKDAMKQSEYNFIISGCKSVENEKQTFNPEMVIANL